MVPFGWGEEAENRKQLTRLILLYYKNKNKNIYIYLYNIIAWLGGTTRQSKGITYFSFTCTPTRKCLEMFGTPHLKSIKQPFYTYSMRDAIRDGLVLDVTQHYSTVAVLAKMSQSTSTSAATTTIERMPPGSASTTTQQSVMEAEQCGAIGDPPDAITYTPQRVSAYPTQLGMPPGGTSATTQPATSQEGPNSPLPCTDGAALVPKDAIQCADPSGNGVDDQSSDPTTTVYSEPRKAAYHILRIPKNDMVCHFCVHIVLLLNSI